MTHKELPSPELLRKLLRYEPDTGKLFWLPRPVEMFKDVRSWNSWTSRFSEQIALNAKSGNGCLQGTILGKKHLTHRVAWALHYGEWPDFAIDHIDGNAENNRIDNLRDVSLSVNQRNRKKNINNTTGSTGVYWISSYRHWLVQVGKKHIGCYKSKADAIKARLDAERENGFTGRCQL